MFSGTDVLQGSVATRMRCDGIFNNSFIANVLDNLSVKQSVKSVKVWQSYSHEFLASLLWDPVQSELTIWLAEQQMDDHTTIT